jgi:hypothetical protein
MNANEEAGFIRKFKVWYKKYKKELSFTMINARYKELKKVSDYFNT